MKKAVGRVGALRGCGSHDKVRTLLAGQALMGAVRASGQGGSMEAAVAGDAAAHLHGRGRQRP